MFFLGFADKRWRKEDKEIGFKDILKCVFFITSELCYINVMYVTMAPDPQKTKEDVKNRKGYKCTRDTSLRVS
jgi:hypothetical protein